MMSTQKIQILLGLLAAIAGVEAVSLPVMAQAVPLQAGQQKPWEISLNFNPPNRGAPTATAGGASRSFCVTGKTPLTILTPASNFGLTTASRPTFFLYMPKTTAKSAEFVLKDKENNDVYRSMVPIPSKPGVLALSLPETAPELEVDKSYRWYFSVICQPKDRLNDVFVESWIQRVAPNQTLTGALQKSAPRDRADLQAEAGLWYDTLKTLAELRQANPNNTALNQDWSALLKSVGLQQVSNEPLVSQPVLTEEATQ